MTQYLIEVIGVLIIVIVFPGVILMYEMLKMFPSDSTKVIDPPPAKKDQSAVI
ncbi:hypothetical protein ACQKP0_01840 [Heyndrickxia sp. NPDC080065]|uniref:hypothetical protein n=1 Tax=Heyndrickxia sp. NPDC080065 TaxID=3390568 RepID=UPI003CFD590D